MQRPQFKLGQRVYYALPDGDEGIVLDIKSYASDPNMLEYLVGFGPGQSAWCLGVELTDQKIY